MIMKKTNAPTSSINGNQNTKPRVIGYVAGRSGGHLLPALTHARAHKQQHPTDRILFFSTDTTLDANVVHGADCVDIYVRLSLDNIPYGRLFAYPQFIWRLGATFMRSLWYMWHYTPEKIVSMGGYVSIPVCLAARVMRIPVELFELNAVPGRATQFLAPYARSVFVCFEQSRSYFPATALVAPYPLRFTASVHVHGVSHLYQYGFVGNKKTVLVLGGSQGSLSINRAIGRWLDAMPYLRDEVQIIHQTGDQDTIDWIHWYRERDIAAYVFAYRDDLAPLYACADLIICRAGAGTLFEVAFFHKPCIVIPLKTHSTSHQLDNARAMAAQHPDLFTVLDHNVLEQNESLFHTHLIKGLHSGY